RGMAQDPLSLCEGAREDARVVGQEHTGKPKSPDHVEEVCDLVSGRAVNGACHHGRIVCNDGHALPAQIGQCRDDGWSEGRLDREEGPVVDQRLKYGDNWIRTARAGWNEVQYVVQPAGSGIGSVPMRWRPPCVERKI